MASFLAESSLTRWSSFNALIDLIGIVSISESISCIDCHCGGGYNDCIGYAEAYAGGAEGCGAMAWGAAMGRENAAAAFLRAAR